jgi:predicted phosphodiesterase
MVSLQLGLISDVHGNLTALDAVLADGASLGVGSWWVLGDLAAIGPEPAEALERIANLPDVRLVRGNTDRYLVTGERPWPHAADVAADESLGDLFAAVAASFSWTSETLGREWTAFLADLPAGRHRRLRDGTTLHGIHASTTSDDGPGITPQASDEDLAAVLVGSAADVICGGHTHQATDRRVGHRRVVNLGSISNPITSDLRATYVVIDDDPEGYTLTHRRVAYDHDAVLTKLERSSHPEARYLASFQLGEQTRYSASLPGSPVFTD